MKIKPYSKNAKKHPSKQIKALADIIKRVGWRQPVLISSKTLEIVVGHGRWVTWEKYGKKLGLKEIWVIDDTGKKIMGEAEKTPMTKSEEIAYRLADNKLNESDWEMDLVIEELKLLNLNDDNLAELTGFDLDLLDEKKWKDVERRILKDDFIIPPFSVWDTKQKYWLDRKQRWQRLFGDSRSGREEDLLGAGLKMLAQRTKEEYKSGVGLGGTSEFDPVICDICYRWFNIENGTILDPFAGGCVRGVVAGVLEQKYTGIDLSEKQIAVDKAKVKELDLKNVKHIHGDSLDMDTLIGEEEFDLIFSCPPYYDLEQYNDGKGDLSMKDTYDDFLKVYNEIIKKSVKRLKNNRFAVFVVGNIRNKEGFYRDFVADTITAFDEAGAKFYNDIILVNAIGTAPVRCRRPFEKNRKVTKIHQNVLIFYKGNVAEISKNYKKINTALISEEYAQ